MYTIENKKVYEHKTVGKNTIKSYVGREQKTVLTYEDGVLTVEFKDYMDNINIYNANMPILIDGVEHGAIAKGGIANLLIGLQKGTEVLTILPNIDNDKIVIGGK